MQFIFLIILFCFLIALFCIYLLSRDDFILLRKNITLEQVFNYAFVNLVVGIFSARIVYVLLHPSLRYLNPLIFLIFPYFPGLSMVGGVIGVMLFLFTVSRKKKIPKGRLYDIFSLSVLLAMPFGMICMELISFISKKKIVFIDIFITLGYIIVFIIFTMFFVKGKVQDGTIGLVSIITFCLFSLIEDIFSVHERFFLVFGKEDIIIFILLLFAIMRVIYQTTLLERRK